MDNTMKMDVVSSNPVLSEVVFSSAFFLLSYYLPLSEKKKIRLLNYQIFETWLYFYDPSFMISLTIVFIFAPFLQNFAAKVFF